MERTDLHETNPTGAVGIRYQLCPACGSFVHFAERICYCIVCGTRLLNECPQCHEHIVFPTGKFCPTCGAALVTGQGQIGQALASGRSAGDTATGDDPRQVRSDQG